jgi:hypothetical protein
MRISLPVACLMIGLMTTVAAFAQPTNGMTPGANGTQQPGGTSDPNGAPTPGVQGSTTGRQDVRGAPADSDANAKPAKPEKKHMRRTSNNTDTSQ